MSPAVAAVLRLSGAVLVLLAWRRPGRDGWCGPRFARTASLGLATAAALMNLAFHAAIARLPLGTAVAVELCEPIAVTAPAARRRPP